MGEKSVVKENLEKKIDLLDRMKYMAGPAALLVGSYFAPEIREKVKTKFDSMPEAQKKDYKIISMAGGALIGAIITISSGYGLYKSYAAKKDEERHRKGNNSHNVVAA